MNPSVLITGGSGLIGKYLTSLLLSMGYRVTHLSRNSNNFGKVRVHRWDPDKGVVDPVVFSGIDTVIHLAGANLGSKRWTGRRMKEIVSSRVDSARLIFKVVNENKIPLKAFISASAIGYYGPLTTERIFTENDGPGEGFLADTCRQWEEAADMFAGAGIRTVKIRSGVVLEKNDSALKRIMLPARFGFLASVGRGHQFMPWIHINDICAVYLKAVEDTSMSGSYNAVSPQHITHGELISTLGKVTGIPVLPVPVPSFLLRLYFGEMSDMVLRGSRVSSEKLVNAGYVFRHAGLSGALSDVLSR